MIHDHEIKKFGEAYDRFMQSPAVGINNEARDNLVMAQHEMIKSLIGEINRLQPTKEEIDQCISASSGEHKPEK